MAQGVIKGFDRKMVMVVWSPKKGKVPSLVTPHDGTEGGLERRPKLA